MIIIASLTIEKFCKSGKEKSELEAIERFNEEHVIPALEKVHTR